MASIYDTVPIWDGASAFNKYDIAKGSDGRSYYSIINSNNGVGNNPITPANLQSKWDGYIILNGVLYPNFWWKPSYNAKVNSKPKITIVQFGNGYQQRISDSINNNMVQLDLAFESRSEKETVSILKFFEERGGQESFVYNMSEIFSKPLAKLSTKFICSEWYSSYASYGIYNINAVLSEVPS